MHEAIQENNPYQRYKEIGGIINEKEYESSLARSRDTTITPEKTLMKEAELIAEFAGIELHNTKDVIDQRTILYGILRADTKPEETKHHHSQMSDQRLFAEVLRMLGDTNALRKLIGIYHKAGMYCPICLKVATSAEECR